jgi:hypothetical protein
LQYSEYNEQRAARKFVKSCNEIDGFLKNYLNYLWESRHNRGKTCVITELLMEKLKLWKEQLYPADHLRYHILELLSQGRVTVHHLEQPMKKLLPKKANEKQADEKPAVDNRKE